MNKKTILVCDDDESILDVLGLILGGAGFIVIPEKNSLNVSSLIELKKPDLVLLDLWMPALNGDQVVKLLRSNPSTKELPVIVISASTNGEEIASAAGASGFIAKPFQINELINQINRHLN